MGLKWNTLYIIKKSLGKTTNKYFNLQFHLLVAKSTYLPMRNISTKYFYGKSQNIPVNGELQLCLSDDWDQSCPPQFLK
jgi:hypothetical protein